MSTTQLLIEGHEVELNKETSFAITRTFENTNSPTDIINTWSKTVSIPFTINNNKLFGMLFRTDRITVSSNNSTGIGFDPSKKLNFKLFYSGSLIMEGYAKLLSIKQTGSTGTYEVSLFGELGAIFNELHNITVTRPSDTSDNAYYIGEIFKTKIDRNLVYNSWTHDPVLDDPIESTAAYNIIGFACTNQGLYDDFSSDSYQYTQDETLDMKNFPINGSTIEEVYKNEGYSWDSVMGDGIDPRAWGEYRSYMQVPYIYMPRMFDILKLKCEELTDYTIALDPVWFNEVNPYYQDLVMMLNKPSRENQSYFNKYNMNFANIVGEWKIADIESRLMNNTISIPIVISEEYPIYTKSIVGNGFKLDDDYLLRMKLYYKFQISWSNTTNGSVYVNNDTAFRVRLIGRKTNGSYKVLHTTIVKSSDYQISEGDNMTIYNVDKFDRTGNNSNYTYYKQYEENVDVIASKDDFGSIVSFGLLFDLLSTQSPFVCNHIVGSPQSNYFMFGSAGRESTDKLKIGIVDQAAVTDVNVVVDSRSNSPLTLETIWDGDVNFFESILRYTKMYKLLWVVDEVNKVLNVLTYDTYFKNHTVEDWTDRVNMSQQFELTPLIYDNKYFLFNYTDCDIALNKSYNETYGYNYGELKMKTQYAFNNDVKELFSDIPTSIVSTKNVLSWAKIKDRNFIYTASGEIMPNFVDSDNGGTSTFGSYFFYNGRKSFNTSLPAVYLTDDTVLQRANDTYMYISSTEYGSFSRRVYTYPLLDVQKDGKYLCLFNKPMKNYCTNTDYSNCIDIYRGVWENMLDKELLNAQTHKISCYIRMTPYDYQQFDFNKFVIINNQLYLVNKIIDYTMDSQYTKCELIKVNDIDNYQNIKMIDDFDIITIPQNKNYYIDGGEKTGLALLHYTSASPVTFEDGSTTKTFNGEFSLTIDSGYIYVNAFSYTEQPEIDNTIVIKNAHNTETFNVQRYSFYPYPVASAPTSIDDGWGTFELSWKYTQSSNPPTIRIEYSEEPEGMVSYDAGNWVEFNVTYIDSSGREIDCMEYVLEMDYEHFENDNLYVTISIYDENGATGSVRIHVNN